MIFTYMFIAYLISVIISYLIFRLTFIVDKKNVKCHPLKMTLLIILIPFINVIASLLILFINMPYGRTITIQFPNVDLRKLFGIKN